MTTPAPSDSAAALTGPNTEGTDHGDNSRATSSTDQANHVAEDVLLDGTVRVKGDDRFRAFPDTGDDKEAEYTWQGAETAREYIDRFIRERDMPGQEPSLHQPEDLKQGDVNTQFLKAAQSGDIETLRARQGAADPDAKNEFSETALHLACRYGHVEIVQELLRLDKHNKTIETKDDDGWTPLLSACFRNHDDTMEILELLFKDFEPNIKARENDGFTALHVASFWSSADVIDFLMKKGADPKAQDNKKHTPLNIACHHRATAEIKAFFSVDFEFNTEANIWVNLACDHKHTPLTLACEFQSAEVVHLLLENGAAFDVEDAGGNTPLILASRFGTAEMVEHILERKPLSWMQQNNNDENALARAISNMSAREAIIPRLLNRGLQLDDKDAFKMFSRDNPGKVSTQHSMWLRVVQDMMKLNSSPDKSLREAIAPILKFASKEEKVAATLNANTEENFSVLMELTEELRLSKDVWTFSWALRRRERSKIRSSLDALFENANLPVSELVSIPKTPLQWSAYYGEHNLVWFLLKESHTIDQNDIGKALAIAQARKRKTWTKGKKGTVTGETDKEWRNLYRPKGSEKAKVAGNPRRYEYTLDILNNATRLVTIPKKQLMRPGPSDIAGKESLLRKHAATIVSLYEQDGQIDILRSSPSVYDLVYADDGEGVNAVMEMARSTFDGMTNTTLDGHMPKKDLKLRWIHLPANIMDWMEHLTLRIYDAKHGDNKKSEDGSNPEDDNDLTSFMDLAQRSQNELPTDKSDFKFMKPICLREGDQVIAKEETRESEESSPQSIAVGTKRLALYTPYVTFGHCYLPEEKTSNQKHADLIELYGNRVLHGPRSLDRFYYNSLPANEMYDRDMSQVVTRGLLNSKMGMPLPDNSRKWPYLTVDQLWIWVIDNETIISSSTHREDEFDTLLIDRVWDSLLQASQTGFGENLPCTVTEMSQFLVSTCVDFINTLTWEDVCQEDDDQVDKDKFGVNRSKRDADSKPILLLYADSINVVAAKEKELFRDFKGRTTQAESDSKKAVENAKMAKEASGAASNTPAEVTTNTKRKDEIHQKDTGSDNERDSQSLQNLEKDERDWMAVNKAATLLDEVKDIREELVILKFLISQQEQVWNGLMGPNPDSRDARSPSFTANELDAMIQMTDAIQKSIKDLLSLEQNSIDIKESMMSRDLVDKSAKQGQILIDLTKSAEKQSESLVVLGERANQQSVENAKHAKILFVFTIVTVIFTPLSFMSSILALNTTISRHNDDGELEWEPGLMYGIIFGASAVCVAPFMVYASFDKVKNGLDWLVSLLSSFWEGIRPGDLGNIASIREDAKSERRLGLASIAEEGRSAGSSTPKPLNPR